MQRVTILNLALQNLRRKPYRTVVMCLCVAVATGTLFFATLMLSGVRNSLAVGRARMGADLVVVPTGFDASAQEAFITGEPTTFYMPGDVAEQIGRLPGVEQTSSQVFVQTLTNARCCIGEFFLVGFEPDSDFTISPWLASHLEGETLDQFEVVAGDRILLRQGDVATFYGTPFTVAGVLEKTGMGIDRTIYVPMEGIRAMVASSAARAEQTLTISVDDISAVMVKVEAGATILDVAEAVEAEVGGVQVLTASHLSQAVSRQMQGVLGVVVGVTAALWLMSLFTIGLVFSLIVNERRRELGLLRAMGATRRTVFRLVVSESTLLAGLGGLLGVVTTSVIIIGFARFAQLRLIRDAGLSGALSRLVQLQLDTPYLMPEWYEVVGIELILVLVALLSGAVASLHPAAAGSRMEPYAAIRQGE